MLRAAKDRLKAKQSGMEDTMGVLIQDTSWHLPDELWQRTEALLPRSLGCHNRRAPDRATMDAIFFGSIRIPGARRVRRRVGVII